MAATHLHTSALRRPVGYSPGAAEQLWKGDTTGRNCELLERMLQGDGIRAALHYTSLAHGANTALPTAAQSDVLSKIDWGHGCLELLEPLTGATRHPFHIYSGCKLSLARRSLAHYYDITYLQLVNGCPAATSCETGAVRLNRTASARNLLYDLGCSNYVDSGKLRVTGGYGSSIPLFRRLYARNCIEFDAIWGWEASPKNLSKWWAKVPKELQPRLTFYNEPVNDTNALDVLLATARPEDFVVMKIDIDTPPLEDRIMHRILSEPSIAALIDELYFEFDPKLGSSPVHVNDSMVEGRGKNRLGPIDKGLHLMKSLRVQGIRSHFWV
ncbi:hypothetical protein AB1Y20_013304 [Prymnesium parvum]|uniref:Uncharacterized protein n=1 Tax=Prymnesium parvum TaxID=97485 RepID=A0AB34IND5_PRYPA